MAYVEPAHSVYKSYLLGEPSLSTSGNQTTQTSGGQGLDTGSSVSDSGTETTTQQDGSPPTTGSTLQTNSLYDPKASDLLTGFMNPYQNRLGAAQGQLKDLQQSFQKEAGPSRTFEGIGGGTVLDRALSSNLSQAEREQALGRAETLLGSKYEGPTGLNAEAAANVKSEFQNLGALAGAMQTGGGLEAALKISTPGLTEGEARWQAQKQFGDIGWRNQWIPQWAGAQEATREYKQAEKTAQNYAKQRQTEEESIAQSGKDYLSGRREKISTELQQLMDQAARENQQVADAYNRMRQTGEPDWSKIEGYTGNELEQRRNEALRKYQEIMDQYSGITDVPLLGKTYWNGNEYWLAPGEEFNATAVSPDAPGIPVSQTGPDGRPIYYDAARHGATGSWAWNGQDLTDQQVRDLISRQTALDTLFQPYSQVRDTYPNTGVNPEDLGEYADVLPLYFGTPYEVGDVTPYLDLVPGSTIAPGAFASDEQKYQLNTIADLLNDNQQVAETDPFESARIVANMNNFLEAENRRLLAAGETTDNSVRAYANQVRQVGSQIQKWLREHPEVQAILSVTA